MEPLNQDHKDSAGVAVAGLELPQVNKAPPRELTASRAANVEQLATP
jgi:hypothetical protein